MTNRKLAALIGASLALALPRSGACAAVAQTAAASTPVVALVVKRMDLNMREADRAENVRYLSEMERARMRITVNDSGRLVDSQGRDLSGRFMYSLDADGHLYALQKDLLSEPASKFRHSSLFAGGPVAATGQLETVDGLLRAADNGSGHYKLELDFSLASKVG